MLWDNFNIWTDSYNFNNTYGYSQKTKFTETIYIEEEYYWGIPPTLWLKKLLNMTVESIFKFLVIFYYVISYEIISTEKVIGMSQININHRRHMIWLACGRNRKAMI